MNEMYERINFLCKNNHTNVTRMCSQLGIGRSALSELASGRTRSLSAATMASIAEYFGVTTDYLLTGRFNRNDDAASDDIQQMVASIRGSGDLRELFRLAIGSTATQMKQIITIIKTIRGIE